jgi:2-polyprenyl-3-methyl-5-hydroxy-6-metoxy-1,4-benzoquinol methylase
MTVMLSAPVPDVILQQVYGTNWSYHKERMDPSGQMGRLLQSQLLAYCTPADFVGRRILDFGSGDGASTFIMSALFPSSSIVGVELDAERVARASRLAQLSELAVTFHCSPSGRGLPPDLGKFDFIMLSAVYEHLLPDERSEVLPKVWDLLNVGGVLFVNQTPHRWFPYDHHSTGLWGINYLPKALAVRATRFARMNQEYNRTAGRNWDRHLRGGLRGGTERSIVKHLTRTSPGSARILQPIKYRDRAEYWVNQTSSRHRLLKRGLVQLFRISERVAGTIPTMNVDVAIRRDR